MATILTEDFNSYDDGDLNGQGGWATSAGSAGTIDVQGGIVKEGAKAIGGAGFAANENVKKTGTATLTGRISVYIRDDGTFGKNAGFTLYEGTSFRILVSLNRNEANEVPYYNGSAFIKIANFTPNTWFLLEIEWRESDHTCRFRVDEGTWTDWVAPGGGAWTNGLDIVRVGVASGGTTYYDYIAENPIAVAAGRSYAFIINPYGLNIIRAGGR